MRTQLAQANQTTDVLRQQAANNQATIQALQKEVNELKTNMKIILMKMDLLENPSPDKGMLMNIRRSNQCCDCLGTGAGGTSVA